MKNSIPKLPVLGLALLLPLSAMATKSLSKESKDAAHDVAKSTKKGVRSFKDKTCELVDGKMSCAGKKLKHKAQNAKDDLVD